MAYPIITDFFRCQVVMQGDSGLAEDQYVNNLYFRNDNVTGGVSSIVTAITNTVDAFYGDTHGGALLPLADRIAGRVSGVEYKIYDLGQAPPRYPIVDPITAAWTPGSTEPHLPGEVALCLSFLAGVGPRRRGRIYIGPGVQSWVTQEGTPTIPRPSDDLMKALGDGAANMLQSTENCSWSVVSPTDGSGHPVTEAWVDNAFDTQRSRGAAPSSRRRWDASGEIV